MPLKNRYTRSERERKNARKLNLKETPFCVCSFEVSEMTNVCLKKSLTILTVLK